MESFEFILTGYKFVTSKRNNKQYILYYLLFNKKVVIPCVSEFNQKFADYLEENLMNDVTECVDLRYVMDKEAFIPYIRL